MQSASQPSEAKPQRTGSSRVGWILFAIGFLGWAVFATLPAITQYRQGLPFRSGILASSVYSSYGLPLTALGQAIVAYFRPAAIGVQPLWILAGLTVAFLVFDRPAEAGNLWPIAIILGYLPLYLVFLFAGIVGQSLEPGARRAGAFRIGSALFAIGFLAWAAFALTGALLHAPRSPTGPVVSWHYFVVALPLMAFASLLGAYRFPITLWRQPIWLLAGHLLAMALFDLWILETGKMGTGDLLLRIVVVGVPLCATLFVLTALGSALRRRAGRA